MDLPTPEMLAGGLWRIPLALPFGPPTVNVYLLRCAEGWILIDTGFGNDDSWQALTGTLASLGLAPQTVRHIIITHLHSDHCGQAARLREITGATIWMHRADAELLWSLKSERSHFEALEALLRRSGTSDQVIHPILVAYERLLATFPALQPDEYLEDGLTLESTLGPLTVLALPGHSPGLCGLYAPEASLLFSSDHILEQTTPHIGWLPEEDCLGDYLGTLDRLAALPTNVILPSHGEPFSDLPGWVKRTRAHLDARTAKINAFLNEGVTLGNDLVRHLWPHELRPLDYQLALTEVEAQLEHRRRRARSEN